MQHATTIKPPIRERIRGWTRTRKILTVTGILLVVGALVAVALTLIRADIEGNVEVPVASPELEWTDASVSMDSTATCTATVSGGVLTLTMSGTTLDDMCRISGMVRTVGTSNQDFVVQDLVFTDVTAETFLGISGTDTCGKPVTDAGTQVAFEVHYEPDAAPGSHPAAADAALVAVDADSYVDANCPRG